MAMNGFGTVQGAVGAESRSGLGILRAAFQHGRTAVEWLQQRRVQQLSSRRLRVTETVSLGEKRFVSLVQVDGSRFLIGGAAGSIALLAALGAEDCAKHEGEGNALTGLSADEA